MQRFTATGLRALGKALKCVVCLLLRAKVDFKAKRPAKSKDDDKIIQWHHNEMFVVWQAKWSFVTFLESDFNKFTNSL